MRAPLPLPLGEVAERSEDGEGKLGCNTLSVPFGDSSPRGRAKGLRMVSREMERICTDTLHSLFYAPLNAARQYFICKNIYRKLAFGLFTSLC